MMDDDGQYLYSLDLLGIPDTALLDNNGSPAGDMKSDAREWEMGCEVKASSRIPAPIQVKRALPLPAPYRSR